MSFTLDTSGTVRVRREYDGPPADLLYRWQHLSPFAQGYVEALFTSADGFSRVEPDRPGFSDLAPETLAQIIEDCAARVARDPAYAHAIQLGRYFWNARQGGQSPGFPPQTVTLSDDGKVHLSTTQDALGVLKVGL